MSGISLDLPFLDIGINDDDFWDDHMAFHEIAMAHNDVCNGFDYAIEASHVHAEHVRIARGAAIAANDSEHTDFALARRAIKEVWAYCVDRYLTQK